LPAIDKLLTVMSICSKQHELAVPAPGIGSRPSIRPVRYGSMMYLGEALLRAGKVAAAEKAFERASAGLPFVGHRHLRRQF
jgi:hypothetical protein